MTSSVRVIRSFACLYSATCLPLHAWFTACSQLTSLGAADLSSIRSPPNEEFLHQIQRLSPFKYLVAVLPRRLELVYSPSIAYRSILVQWARFNAKGETREGDAYRKHNRRNARPVRSGKKERRIEEERAETSESFGRKRPRATRWHFT